MIAGQGIKSCRYRPRVSVNVHRNLQNRELNVISVTLTMPWSLVSDRLVYLKHQNSVLSDFDHSIAFAGGKRARLNISETADLLGFLHATVCRVSTKEKKTSRQ